MSKDFEIEHYADSPASRERLFRFYLLAYPDSPWLLEEKRFIWHNLTPPMNKPDDSGIWLLIRGGEIVGQNIYSRYPLSIAGQVHTGICSTNLIVLPELVGKRLGHLLIERNETFSGVPFAVGITPASTRAFQKRGWHLHSEARLYSRFIKPKPNLAYVGLTGAKAAIGTIALSIANIATTLWFKMRREPLLENMTVKEIEAFDTCYDSYWMRFLEGFAIHFERNAELLNYKYATRQDVTHTKLLYYHDGVVVGYGVYRISTHPVSGLKLGRIVDFVYDPSLGKKLISNMIRVMTDRMADCDLDGIVAIAADREIASALIENGLYLSRVQPAIIKETTFSLSDLRKSYKNLWYITLGDSDLDNYW